MMKLAMLALSSMHILAKSMMRDAFGPTREVEEEGVGQQRIAPRAKGQVEDEVATMV